MIRMAWNQGLIASNPSGLLELGQSSGPERAGFSHEHRKVDASGEVEARGQRARWLRDCDPCVF